MTDVATAIRQCQGCDLWRDRRNAVPIQGTGPIAIVGEAPGAEEDQFGIPFIGPAGQLLNEALGRVGLSRSGVATFNVVACRPRDNKFANAEDVDAPEKCRGHFDNQLAVSGAWLVVLAGGAPMRVVSKRHGQVRTKITNERGKAWWYDHRLWLSTFHPSYVLRTGGLDKPNGEMFVADLKKARELSEGATQVEPPDDWGDLMPVAGIRPTSFPATVYSPLLGETVLVVKSLDDAPADSPYPIWTVPELARIRAYAGTKFGYGDLSRVAAIKRIMRGEIVQ